MKRYRTDRHNNPIAAVYGLFKQASSSGSLDTREPRLIEGIHFEKGDPFRSGGRTFYTGRILADPIAVSIALIDRVGFYTGNNRQRWSYIAIPWWVWRSMNEWQKTLTIYEMYQHEGGVEMEELFQKRLAALDALQTVKSSIHPWK